jgi:hypothetical protein
VDSDFSVWIWIGLVITCYGILSASGNELSEESGLP